MLPDANTVNINTLLHCTNYKNMKNVVTIYWIICSMNLSWEHTIEFYVAYLTLKAYVKFYGTEFPIMEKGTNAW